VVEAATGWRIWSEAYNAQVTDIFGAQEDIIRPVVGTAVVTFTRHEDDRAFSKPLADLAAYECVPRGHERPTSATDAENDVSVCDRSR